MDVEAARAAIGTGAGGAGNGAGASGAAICVGRWINGAPNSTFARFTKAK